MFRESASNGRSARSPPGFSVTWKETTVNSAWFRCSRLLAGMLMAMWLLTSSLAALAADPQWEFELKISPDIHDQPFSGRLYVMLSKTRAEPRTGPSWFRPEMFASLDVENLKPGRAASLSSDDPTVNVFPPSARDASLEGYRVQAVARLNPLERLVGQGPGNGFSSTVPADTPGPVSLEINQLVPPRKFKQSRWSRLLEVPSKRLSGFHGREVTQRAAVMLPASYYDSPTRRYPVIFTIPGFGGTHFSGQRTEPIAEENEGGVEFIRVLLDPSCPLGHHVFANSANNGPVGDALIHELIPQLDRDYRTVAEPTARFLTGHSSGGWSSLWLQVTYPEFFGGTWSTSPDPVDFRDFQRINMYADDENMYVDGEGQRRPLARSGDRVLLWYDDFSRMEWVLGYGGQLHSFEAVFSPRGADQRPQLVWDRETGVIDTEVARTWEKYDIRLILERNWKRLGPKLENKLRIHMGDVDTFYLEGATILLKKSLEDLGSDAVVEIHAGRDHSSIMTRQLRNRMRQEMVAQFLKHHPDAALAKPEESPR